MNTLGTITNMASGMFVSIPALKAEYGPLSFLGEQGDYAIGDKVLVTRVGADEYVVVGVVSP